MGPDHLGHLTGGRAEGRHVVDRAGQLRSIRPSDRKQGVDAFGHGHPRNPGGGPHETRARMPRCRGVDHLGNEVAGASGGLGLRGNHPRQTKAAEVDQRSSAIVRQSAIVVGVVASEVFAVELVGTVHRRGKIAVVLADGTGTLLVLRPVHAVHGDGAGQHEADGSPVGGGMGRRELQQVPGAADVDLVCNLGHMLRPGREQRGEMVDVGHLVHRDELLHEPLVADVTDVDLVAKRPGALGNLLEIRGDDADVVVCAETMDEPMADLPRCAGQQYRSSLGFRCHPTLPPVTPLYPRSPLRRSPARLLFYGPAHHRFRGPIPAAVHLP